MFYLFCKLIYLKYVRLLLLYHMALLLHQARMLFINDCNNNNKIITRGLHEGKCYLTTISQNKGIQSVHICIQISVTS